MKPLCIDLYCGLGGWAEGFLAEGYDVVGFDIERHDYGTGDYPGQLVLQDVLTIDGRKLKDATVIVGSSPCQEFSYRAMPWKRAKELPPPNLGIQLFNAQFFIQREASEAAGRYIPLVAENVKGAQRWVGRAAWHYGSYYLWGDVPAVMPFAQFAQGQKFNPDGTGHPPGSWFAIADSVNRGQKVGAYSDPRRNGGRGVHLTSPRENAEGVKGHSGRAWFADPDVAGHLPSASPARKAASAMIAKIPFPLAQHVARCFKR